MKVEKIAQLTGHNAGIYSLALGEQTHEVLSAAGDGWIVRWNLNDPEVGQLVAKVETQAFALLPMWEQQQLIVGNMNGGVHWVDLDDPTRTKNIAHHKKGVFGILQNKEHVLTIGGSGVITKWAIEARRAIESAQLSYASLRSIDYSAARNELAIGASDNNIYFLDADTLEIKHTQIAAHENSVFAVRYLPNSSILLSGGRDAYLRAWDLDNNFEPLLAQPAHWFTINDIAIRPDGMLFATASRDKTIKIWDASTLQLVKVIEAFRDSGHVNSVNTLFWSAHQNYLISGSDDRTLGVWQIVSE